MDEENLMAHGVKGSPVAGVRGITPTAPASQRSTATTAGAIATAATGVAPLSEAAEDSAPRARCSVHYPKGLLGHGNQPKHNPAHPRPISAGDGLFHRITDFAELYDAYVRARAGKRDQPIVARFTADLESELISIQNELLWRTWQPGHYEAFEVHEPKKRMIYAPAFRDRVVHHSIHAALSPLWERVFHPRSYACRVAKGTHVGADMAQGLIRRSIRRHGIAYALKGDVSQYFASIDHEILKKLLRRRISCAAALWLLDLIVDTSPGVDGVGIPLGNLTSQLFANVYLHELDHYVANVLQLGGYVRYMDDFVVIHSDKAFLREALDAIREFLRADLRLTLNAKTQIFPVRPRGGRALDFLGYRIYGDHRRLRRRSVRKGFARARDYARDPNPHNLDRLTSWYAHARHAEPTGMMRRLFAELASQRKDRN
jgi:retron-type reverse transcriptase